MTSKFQRQMGNKMKAHTNVCVCVCFAFCCCNEEIFRERVRERKRESWSVRLVTEEQCTSKEQSQKRLQPNIESNGTSDTSLMKTMQQMVVPVSCWRPTTTKKLKEYRTRIQTLKCNQRTNSLPLSMFICVVPLDGKNKPKTKNQSIKLHAERTEKKEKTND